MISNVPPSFPRRTAGAGCHHVCLARLQSPPCYLKLPLQNNTDCLRVRDVLLLENAGGEAVFVVRVEHRDRLLQNDGAVVEFFVYEVDRASRNFHTVSESLFLGFKSRKCRQQRGMNVKDTPGELLYEPWRQQTHVPRKTDDVNLVFLKRCHDFTIVLDSVSILRRNYQRGKPQPASGFNATCILQIGNNDGDPRVPNAPSGNILGNGLEFRAASG